MQQNQSTAPVQVIAKVLAVAHVYLPAVLLVETLVRVRVAIHATTAAKDHVMDVNVPS